MRTSLKILSLVALATLVSLPGCKKDDFYLQNSPELSVSTNSITVSGAGDVVVIDVTSTRRWIVTPSIRADWFAITPIWLTDDDGNILQYGGEDNGQIIVRVNENLFGPRILTLRIETAGGLTQQIDISQLGQGTNTLLFENFGTHAPAGAPFPNVEEYEEHFRREGIGASYVRYRSTGGTVSLRSSPPLSPAPFSGGANLHFSAVNDAAFYVDSIMLLGTERVNVSFATNQTSDYISLAYRLDDGDWITANFVKTTTEWGGVSINILDIADAQMLGLRFTTRPVQYGIRIDDIRVESADIAVSFLAISQSTLNVGSEGSDNSINIESSTSWTATAGYDADWIFLSQDPYHGTRNGRLDFNVIQNTEPVQRIGTITISTDDGAITRTLTITQDPEVIFRETFGSINTSSPWPTVANFRNWGTIGTSAESITFSSSGGLVDVRSTSPSVGYPRASGGNNVMFSAGNGGVFYIDGIVTGNYRQFFFDFGTNRTSDVISVSFSTDDKETWWPIPFNKTTADAWELVETMFSIPEVVDGIILRIESSPVQFGARIDDLELRVSEPIIPQLIVTPKDLDFSRDADTLEIMILGSVNWTITSSENWITASETSGSYNATIEISVTENTTGEDRSATLTISGAGVSDQIVTITQTGEKAPTLPTLILADDFGTGAPTTSPFPWVSDWIYWNKIGSSAETVSYSGTGVSVRANQTSSGYPGASGGNNVMFAANGTGVFYVNEIVPDGYKNFILSFGTNQNHDIISVYFSYDGGANWKPTSFEKTTTTWGLVETERFEIPADVEKLRLRFTAGTTQFGARIDDIKLVAIP